MGTYLNNTLEGDPITVAQLAVAHPGALAVFTKYNIDYCCGGHRSIEDACTRIGLDPERIKAEILETANSGSTQFLRPENWSSGLLIDFIIQNHHGYVRMAIAELEPLLNKVCDAHGNDCPELKRIRENFRALSDELTSHMKKEEFILFPAIKRLEAGDVADHPLSLTIQAPVEAMEHEHEIAGRLIKQIRSFSNNYTPPDFACPTFTITYKKLQEFDNDLMRHIHLENNILFERVKGMTKTGGSCFV